MKLKSLKGYHHVSAFMCNGSSIKLDVIVSKNIFWPVHMLIGRVVKREIRNDIKSRIR